MEEVKAMRKYETTFIINPELEEKAIEEVIEKVKGIISNNAGEVVNVDNWGVKKLAYEVKKRRSGYYSCIQFNGTSETLDELSRNFRIMDDLLKFIIVRLED
jgi:small subunit ribosomal protein S6